MKDPVLFEIPRIPAALESVNGQVEALLEERNMPAKVIYAVQFALEELVTNIITYATDASLRSPIRLLLDFGEAKLAMEIDYEGDCFDPFARKEPDLNLPLEDRPIGGLGIHLTGKLMDECRHSYRGGRNILEMWKSTKNNTQA